MLKKITYLTLIASICLIFSLGSNGIAKESQIQLPLKVRAEGIVQIDMTTLQWIYPKHEGVLTHGGKFTSTGSGTIELTSKTTGIATGGGTIFSANKDQIEWTAVALLDFSNGEANAEITFSGGSGRFENVSGKFTTTYTIDLETGAFEYIGLGTMTY